MPSESPDGACELLELRWDSEWQPAVREVRMRVFVDEQRIPAEYEFDSNDAVSVHVLAVAGKRDAVGTGRLDPVGRLGRIAVVDSHRGRGIGSMLVARLLDCARRAGHGEVWLHSQTHARRLYERHGFVAEGTEFMEDGIPHIRMRAFLQR